MEEEDVWGEPGEMPRSRGRRRGTSGSKLSTEHGLCPARDSNGFGRIVVLGWGGETQSKYAAFT